MPVQIESYGRTQAGEEVQRVTLRDGLQAEILTYGGIVARLDAPDRHGRRANVVLGLENIEAYETRNPRFGAAIGRYAGRIAGGSFTLDGTEYTLSKNEGANTLHGGARGFDKRLWRIERAEGEAVTLAYTSADGEEGFPGRLEVRLTYEVLGTALRLRYEAHTDRPTVLNLTNHSYFNLGGEGSGDVFDHLVQIEADQFLEVDAESIPTGELLDVAGTPFDFRAPHAVGERIRVAHPQILLGLGYDACFVLRGSGLRTAAWVRHPGNGRVMTVRTDQPGVQLYSANKLTGALHGPSGRVYRSGDGLCLETQHFPDGPHRPAFPSTVLRPGQSFRSETEYVFSVA